MNINKSEITKSFDPKIRFVKAEKYLRISGEVELNNDELYEQVEELTTKAYPSFKDEWDTRWKSKEKICLPEP